MSETSEDHVEAAREWLAMHLPARQYLAPILARFRQEAYEAGLAKGRSQYVSDLEAYERGRADERAEVVKWLRALVWPGMLQDQSGQWADWIKRGDHLEKRDGK